MSEINKKYGFEGHGSLHTIPLIVKMLKYESQREEFINDVKENTEYFNRIFNGLKHDLLKKKEELPVAKIAYSNQNKHQYIKAILNFGEIIRELSVETEEFEVFKNSTNEILFEEGKDLFSKLDNYIKTAALRKDTKKNVKEKLTEEERELYFPELGRSQASSETILSVLSFDYNAIPDSEEKKAMIKTKNALIENYSQLFIKTADNMNKVLDENIIKVFNNYFFLQTKINKLLNHKTNFSNEIKIKENSSFKEIIEKPIISQEDLYSLLLNVGKNNLKELAEEIGEEEFLLKISKTTAEKIDNFVKGLSILDFTKEDIESGLVEEDMLQKLKNILKEYLTINQISEKIGIKKLSEIKDDRYIQKIEEQVKIIQEFRNEINRTISEKEDLKKAFNDLILSKEFYDKYFSHNKKISVEVPTELDFFDYVLKDASRAEKAEFFAKIDIFIKSGIFEDIFDTTSELFNKNKDDSLKIAEYFLKLKEDISSEEKKIYFENIIQKIDKISEKELLRLTVSSKNNDYIVNKSLNTNKTPGPGEVDILFKRGNKVFIGVVTSDPTTYIERDQIIRHTQAVKNFYKQSDEDIEVITNFYSPAISYSRNMMSDSFLRNIKKSLKSGEVKDNIEDYLKSLNTIPMLIPLLFTWSDYEKEFKNVPSANLDNEHLFNTNYITFSGENNWDKVENIQDIIEHLNKSLILLSNLKDKEISNNLDPDKINVIKTLSKAFETINDKFAKEFASKRENIDILTNFQKKFNTTYPIASLNGLREHAESIYENEQLKKKLEENNVIKNLINKVKNRNKGKKNTL